MRHAFAWFAVYAFVILVGFAVWDYAVARWRRAVADRVAQALTVERQCHAAELAEARRQHREAQAWLLETHRMELARHEARMRQRVDEAVAEAMTSCARDPRAA